MTTRVTIEPIRAIGQRGQRYRVLHDGQALLDSAREPLLDTCRALLARGITGRVEMWRAGKQHCDMAVDIERGAGLTVAETTDHGPVFRPWKAWDEEGDRHAFPAATSEPGAALRQFQVGRWPRKNRPSLTRSAA